MPANSPTPASDDLPRGILLVEEYSALAVAISSALAKFAPLHAVEVAHNFGEAETIAALMRPELFVLDLDPPPKGEIEFLNRLKTQYPDARVLVIAAGTAHELRTERGAAGAIRFLEKPFAFGEFGGAVQALLGSRSAPGASGARNTLRHLRVVDIVQLKCLAASTAVVRIETGEGKTGEIHFIKGQIVHAAAGSIEGVKALEEIAAWRDARLSETEAVIESPRTIHTPWPLILLRMVRQLDEESPRSSLGHAAIDPEAARPGSGRKILVIDDTEMLLVFAADVLATADQNFIVVTASSGAEGLRLAVSERPDLVLLDYSLTDMTGDRVCRALLENRATARLPVLMMSGHLGELAKTAEQYENVVAALPKPFLSGDLINAVENALAGRQSTTSPAPPLSSAPASLSGAVPAAWVERSSSSSPNGRGVRSAPGPAQPTSASAGGVLVRPTKLSVTLAFKIVAVQFTPSLRVESATLEPVDRIVAVKMGEQKGLSGIPLASGFRLERISLGQAGQIETLRLVRSGQAPEIGVPNNSFPVGASTRQASAGAGLQLAATSDGPFMRVWLTAPFDLLAVELSDGLQVAVALLRSQQRLVALRNESEGSGRPFEVIEARLDPGAELQSLLVRP